MSQQSEDFNLVNLEGDHTGTSNYYPINQITRKELTITPYTPGRVMNQITKSTTLLLPPNKPSSYSQQSDIQVLKS